MNYELGVGSKELCVKR